MTGARETAARRDAVPERSNSQLVSRMAIPPASTMITASALPKFQFCRRSI
ncbi:hypothetical protein RAA17_00555 [Komagataeibacter rhaeticus]|nr:hypothetical protein [Komagataeibacter rhaeticus]